MVHKSDKSKDHYVSQTYLRHFSCSDGFVQVYRKKEKFERAIPIDSVCIEIGGDICDYFENKYAIREILAKCEPLWNIFIKAVEDENILEVNANWPQDDGIAFLQWIVLYFAYLRCLSPTTIGLAQKQEEFFANQCILPFTPELNEEMKQAIKNGEIRVECRDKQYHKAESLKFLAPVAEAFYNKKWEIFVNTTDTKFITSDAPFVPMMGCLYFPLTPFYALLIRPDVGNDIQYKKITKNQVKKNNKELVKYASDFIISSEQYSKLTKLADNHRDYQPDVDFKIFNGEAGLMNIFFQHKAGRVNC